MLNLTDYYKSTDKYVEIPLNSDFYIDVFEHGSVGNTNECKLKTGKIKLTKSLYIADHPECEIPGGDEGIRRYFFKAIEKGNGEIIIKEYFREKLENKSKLFIEVIE